MVENIPSKRELHASRGHEQRTAGEIAERPVQRGEKQDPRYGPGQPLVAVGRGDAVDRLTSHPRDQQPEEGGYEQPRGAQEERRPVARQVGAQGEELADGGPLTWEPDWG